MPKINTPQSSQIESVAYDASAETLAITFRKSHKTYVYAGVPQAMYEALLTAASVGKYFQANIARAYPFEILA